MYKLSPSDFAYLYEECKLCYVLKVKYQIFQPSMPMPGVFAAINAQLQGNLLGKTLSVLAKNLPDGQVVNQEGWVESVVIPETSAYIKGKYDLLLKNPDQTHTLIDLKISQPSDDKIDKYQTQLAAYKFALENPKEGQPLRISRLGLLVFYPQNATFENNLARLNFPVKWLEVPYNEQKFFHFIKSIDKLLTEPLPPESKTCKWCQYRHIGEKISHQQNKQNPRDPLTLF